VQFWPSSDERSREVYTLGIMSDVTRLIESVHKGDRQAAADLLPLVYDELRQLAATKLAAEAPGNTLSATALVHEAFMRLVGDQYFEGCGHFFAAAAEAMRRILIDRARDRKRLKRGGGRRRQDLDLESILDDDAPADDVIDLDGAIARLAAVDAQAAALVKLRLFAGLTVEHAASALGISRRTAERDWTFARTWLFGQLGPRDDGA
jgi:RNA polymerase sigma factor (TIGR02999 family)